MCAANLIFRVSSDPVVGKLKLCSNAFIAAPGLSLAYISGETGEVGILTIALGDMSASGRKVRDWLTIRAI